MYVPIGCGSLTILYLDKRYLKPFNSYEIFQIEFFMFFDKVIILWLGPFAITYYIFSTISVSVCCILTWFI